MKGNPRFSEGLLVCLLSMLAAASVNAETADLIFLGNHIVTADHSTASAAAVAVSGQRILAVGDQATVLALKSANTRVIELGDRALLPGFIDAHGHVGIQSKLLTFVNLSPPPVGPVENVPDIIAALSGYISSHQTPADQWVVGFGYDDSLLKEGRHPERDELDAASADHPVFLIHASGHLGVANSRALELAGITAESENPPGGIIRRRPGSNDPNGVLEESAMLQVYTALPQPTVQQSVEQLSAVQKYYASKGITTIQEGGASQQDIDVLSLAAAQNKLFLDIVAFAHWRPDVDEMPARGPFGQYENRFKLGGLKLVLDGSPQGKTAYLSEAYHVPPAGQDEDYRGYPAYPPEVVNRAVEQALAQRIPLLAHANGDAAAQMLIDAVALAARATAIENSRVVMIHAQTVRDDQLDQMAQLGMIPSFFPAHTFFWGDWHRDSVLGSARADRISPTQSAVQRGLAFTIHNDSPVTPPAPIDLIWSTVNRRTRSNDILGPLQRISTYQAIEAVTIHAAYQYFEEADKGSITPGKLADLVILSGNPMTIEPEKIREIKVLETFSHGQSVYVSEQSVH